MRVKEQLEQQIDKELDEFIGYAEWLRENNCVLSGDDLDCMEKSYINNIDYKKEN